MSGMRHALMSTVPPSCQEMIKGIRNDSTGAYLRFYDTLTVPIIENTADERDLTASMEQAMIDYPETSAVLVRRHGVYVWGPSWEKAKTMCECFDYLFEIALKMRAIGVPTDAVPRTSLYRESTMDIL